jgi:anti-sigma B factor antagonist
MIEHTTLPLDGELTIYRAAEIKPMLMAALSDSPEGLDVELSGVTEIDSAGIQLLMAAKRAAMAAGGSLVLSGHSEAVSDALDLLNLRAFFDDQGSMPLPQQHEGDEA